MRMSTGHVVQKSLVRQNLACLHVITAKLLPSPMLLSLLCVCTQNTSTISGTGAYVLTCSKAPVAVYGLVIIMSSRWRFQLCHAQLHQVHCVYMSISNLYLSQQSKATSNHAISTEASTARFIFTGSINTNHFVMRELCQTRLLE